MSAPSLTIVHRSDVGLVIARWQRATTPAELQRDYLAIRAVADEARCGHWLLDLRRREDITEPLVNTWFGHEFAPALRGRYAAPVRLAFLVSPLRAQQPVIAVVSAAEADCLVATFIEEATAYQWLVPSSY